MLRKKLESLEMHRSPREVTSLSRARSPALSHCLTAPARAQREATSPTRPRTISAEAQLQMALSGQLGAEEPTGVCVGGVCVGEGGGGRGVCVCVWVCVCACVRLSVSLPACLSLCPPASLPDCLSFCLFATLAVLQAPKNLTNRQVRSWLRRSRKLRHTCERS